MRSVLDVEGPVYRFLSRWIELILLSLVWWLLSLFVITAPVATSWLFHGVRQTRAGGPMPRFGETLAYLRARFGVCTRLGLMHLAVAALVMIALVGPSPGGWYGQIVLIVGTGVGITVALVAPWSIALLDEHSSARDAIRAAYHRALCRSSLAVVSAATVSCGAVALLVAPGWMQLIVLLAAPGVVAAAVARLCDAADRRLPSPPETSSDAPAPRVHRLSEAS